MVGRDRTGGGDLADRLSHRIGEPQVPVGPRCDVIGTGNIEFLHGPGGGDASDLLVEVVGVPDRSVRTDRDVIRGSVAGILGDRPVRRHFADVPSRPLREPQRPVGCERHPGGTHAACRDRDGRHQIRTRHHLSGKPPACGRENRCQQEPRAETGKREPADACGCHRFKNSYHYSVLAGDFQQQTSPHPCAIR